MVTADLPREREGEFRDWWHGEYLPKNVAEVPTWAACRRYASISVGPGRYITTYGPWDEPGIARSLSSMRGAARISDNLAWHRWEPYMTHEDAATFRPIFRYPG